MSAFDLAHLHPYGVSQAAWEEALRAHVQAGLEAAMLHLSADAPELLSDDGAKYQRIAADIVLPAGETLRLVASIELVE